jgi:hypothetical protein
MVASALFSFLHFIAALVIAGTLVLLAGIVLCASLMAKGLGT